MSAPVISKEQKAEITSSLQRWFTENLESELSDLQAAALLDYVLREIAPFAYNQGVEDARRQLATAVEDLGGNCFQEGLTYWKTPKGAGAGTARAVRRKPHAAP